MLAVQMTFSLIGAGNTLTFRTTEGFVPFDTPAWERITRSAKSISAIEPFFETEMGSATQADVGWLYEKPRGHEIRWDSRPFDLFVLTYLDSITTGTPEGTCRTVPEFFREEVHGLYLKTNTASMNRQLIARIVSDFAAIHRGSRVEFGAPGSWAPIADAGPEMFVSAGGGAADVRYRVSVGSGVRAHDIAKLHGLLAHCSSADFQLCYERRRNVLVFEPDATPEPCTIDPARRLLRSARYKPDAWVPAISGDQAEAYITTLNEHRHPVLREVLVEVSDSAITPREIAGCAELTLWEWPDENTDCPR